MSYWKTAEDECELRISGVAHLHGRSFGSSELVML